MALNASTYSGKQFAVYLAAEEATGTFNTTDASFRRVDVEGITFPSFSPTQEFEMRSGSGRIAEFDQVFATTKRVMTEFTLTGRLTRELWLILCENATGDEFDGGTDNSVLTLAYNYGGLGFKVGTNPTNATDYSHLLSVYFSAPTVSDSYSLKSCTCTSFNISADMDTAGGRFNYSATFQTWSQPAKAEQDGLVAAATAIGSNFVYLSEADEKHMDITNYDGSSDQADTYPLFKSFSMTIDCPTQFLGATGANAEPEVWGKALPELSITWGGSAKYDEELDNLVEAFRDAGSGTALSYLSFYLADVDKAGGTYEAPTGDFFGTPSTTYFGMSFAKSKLISCEVSSDDVAMVNFEAKVLAPTSGNAVHFLAGDNAS